MTPTTNTQAVETAISCFEEIIAQDDQHAYTARVGLEALRAELTRPQEVATEVENKDGPCQEADGCPTERAVLQRFWRQQNEPKENAASRVPVAETFSAEDIDAVTVALTGDEGDDELKRPPGGAGGDVGGRFKPKLSPAAQAISDQLDSATPAAEQGDAKDARPDSFHSDSGDRDRVQGPGPTDAEMYQWLREHCDSMSLNPPLTVAKVTGWGLEGWSGDDLSSAIRAAMLASKPAVVEMKP